MITYYYLLLNYHTKHEDNLHSLLQLHTEERGAPQSCIYQDELIVRRRKWKKNDRNIHGRKSSCIKC